MADFFLDQDCNLLPSRLTQETTLFIFPFIQSQQIACWITIDIPCAMGLTVIAKFVLTTKDKSSTNFMED